MQACPGSAQFSGEMESLRPWNACGLTRVLLTECCNTSRPLRRNMWIRKPKRSRERSCTRLVMEKWRPWERSLFGVTTAALIQHLYLSCWRESSTVAPEILTSSMHYGRTLNWHFHGSTYT